MNEHQLNPFRDNLKQQVFCFVSFFVVHENFPIKPLRTPKTESSFFFHVSLPASVSISGMCHCDIFVPLNCSFLTFFCESRMMLLSQLSVCCSNVDTVETSWLLFSLVYPALSVRKKIAVLKAILLKNMYVRLLLAPCAWRAHFFHLFRKSDKR